MDDDVVGRIEVGDCHVGGAGTRHRDNAVVGGDCDRIAAAGGVDDDRVLKAVRGAIRSQIDVDVVNASPGQIIDRDEVRTAQRVDVERLHAVHIHDNGGDIAGEPHPRAIGREIDLLVDVRAVEYQRVVTALTFNRVAAVAGIPDEGIVTGSQLGRIVAAPADDKIIAGAADNMVVAIAAVDREIDCAGNEQRGIDIVGAQAAIHDQRVGDSGSVDGHLCRQSVDGNRCAAADYLDLIDASRAIDDHGVGLTVSLAASRHCGEVDRDLLHVRSAEIVDRDGVGTAQGGEPDLLDAAEVHDDGTDVAKQPGARAVRRDVEELVDIGAVEDKRVGAALTLDDVAAIARIPDERVIAVAKGCDIIAAPAGYGVISVAAGESVVALTAGDDVVAGASVDHNINEGGGGIDRIVAPESIDRERVVGGFGAIDGYLGGEPRNDDRAVVVDDADVIAARNTRDGYGISLSISDSAAGRSGKVDRDLLHVRLAEVIDHNVVGAAARGDRDTLDMVEVHADGAHVARENRVAILCRDGHLLADVCAVELERVEAVLSVDDIAAIARIPHEGVVAGTKRGGVAAATTSDGVIAVAAD